MSKGTRLSPSLHQALSLLFVGGRAWDEAKINMLDFKLAGNSALHHYAGMMHHLMYTILPPFSQGLPP